MLKEMEENEIYNVSVPDEFDDEYLTHLYVTHYSTESLRAEVFEMKIVEYCSKMETYISLNRQQATELMNSIAKALRRA